jgi:S1-C subfamily serine protease
MEKTPQTTEAQIEKQPNETQETTLPLDFLQTSLTPPDPPTQPAPEHTALPAPQIHSRQIRRHALPAILIITLLVASLVSVACIYNVVTLNQQVTALQNQITSLQSSVTSGTNTVATSYIDSSSTSLSALYSEVKDSVVTIECTLTEYTYSPWGGRQAATTSDQGSGWIYEYNGEMVVITNNHVIADATSITVTFADGNAYTATVLGQDSKTDLAVLTTGAPSSEYHPLQIKSSSTLSVGDTVVAIGSPYGLTGTMTSGIVSALDRTITVTSDTTGSSYDMTSLIQTSAPINSGNSGGPLMTLDGKVVGMTTAIVSNSDGLGFAVNSDTILNEIGRLIA